jgi:hypothetical protein
MSKPVHTPVHTSDEKAADLQEPSIPAETLESSKRAKRRFDERAQTAFCELTSAGMSCAAATRELGFNRDTPYHVAKQDEAFAAAWKEARETGADYLEDVAYKLASEGGEDVEYDGDGNIRRRTKRAPNPAILARVLAAWRPERWGDKPTQIGIGVQVVGQIKHEQGLTMGDLLRDSRVLRPGESEPRPWTFEEIDGRMQVAISEGGREIHGTAAKEELERRALPPADDSKEDAG